MESNGTSAFREGANHKTNSLLMGNLLSYNILWFR
jgi:hypothetical protein